MATAKKRRNPEEEVDQEEEKVEEEIWECDRCGAEVEQLNAVGDEEWCDECADEHSFSCDRCNERFSREASSESTPHDSGYSSLCENCANAVGVFTCAGCSREYTERAFGREYGNESYCQNCAEDLDDDDGGPVEGYHSHDRIWNRFGDSKSRIYYGVELEAIHEDRHGDFMSVADDINRKYGQFDGKEFLFTEDDCSLQHRGYETIFHPMSPEFVASHKDLFGKILKDMVDGGMISYEAPNEGISAGMHVSVMFNRLRLWERRKLLALIYENVALTTMVSRRLQEDLEQWARVRPPAPITQMVMKKAGYHAKMVAVNLKRVKDERIGKFIELAEVRIFRGTLKLESFLMNIEYVIACVSIAKDLRYGMRDTTEAHIKGYIHENRSTFPHIYAWMKSKGILK